MSAPPRRAPQYGLIAAAEGYWRAFQTNGSEQYHPADILRGIVLSIVRFGTKDGMRTEHSPNDRIVGEFFAVKSGSSFSSKPKSTV